MDVIDRHECYDLMCEGYFLIARLLVPHHLAESGLGRTLPAIPGW